MARLATQKPEYPACFEYLIQVPANRIGHTQLSLSQLKVMQEVITLSVFAPFAVLNMNEPLKWNYLWAGVCLLGAGRYTQIIIGEAQPAMKTADPRKPDAPVVAQYGSYTVNEGNKTIAMKTDGAAYSPRAGTQGTYTVVAINGDTMSLVGSPRKDQIGTFSPHLELKRAK